MVDPRQIRRIEDKVDALASTPVARAVGSTIGYGYAIVGMFLTLLIGMVAVCGALFLARTAPPMAILVVPVLAVVVTQIRTLASDAKFTRIETSTRKSGANRKDRALERLPHNEGAARATAFREIAFGVLMGSLPVVFLLCVPFQSSYFMWAVAVTPFAVLAVWIALRQRQRLRRARLDTRSIPQFDGSMSEPATAPTSSGVHEGWGEGSAEGESAWSPHGQRSADLPGIQAHSVAANSTPRIQPADLPLMLGAPYGGPKTWPGADLLEANVLITHDQGLYMVYASLPSSDMLESDWEPHQLRAIVLEQAATGELWTPERILLSRPWHEVSAWRLKGATLDLWFTDGRQIRWGVPPKMWGRVRAEVSEQYDAVTSQLQNRVGPPAG